MSHEAARLFARARLCFCRKPSTVLHAPAASVHFEIKTYNRFRFLWPLSSLSAREKASRYRFCNARGPCMRSCGSTATRLTGTAHLSLVRGIHSHKCNTVDFILMLLQKVKLAEFLFWCQLCIRRPRASDRDHAACSTEGLSFQDGPLAVCCMHALQSLARHVHSRSFRQSSSKSMQQCACQFVYCLQQLLDHLQQPTQPLSCYQTSSCSLLLSAPLLQEAFESHRRRSCSFQCCRSAFFKTTRSLFAACSLAEPCWE